MPKTLLLADDSVTIQKVVGISFANEDIVLLTVDNGDDAIARAREARPDVVLADVVMPGKNGYDVCQAIKAEPSLAHIPVLLLTGTFEAFDEQRAARVGADGHITKPFEAQALVDKVNALLARPTASEAGQESHAAAAPIDAPRPQRPLAPPPQPVSHTADTAYDFFDEEVTAPRGASEPTQDTTVVLSQSAAPTSFEDGFSLDDPGPAAQASAAAATSSTGFGSDELDVGSSAEEASLFDDFSAPAAEPAPAPPWAAPEPADALEWQEPAPAAPESWGAPSSPEPAAFGFDPEPAPAARPELESPFDWEVGASEPARGETPEWFAPPSVPDLAATRLVESPAPAFEDPLGEPPAAHGLGEFELEDGLGERAAFGSAVADPAGAHDYDVSSSDLGPLLAASPPTPAPVAPAAASAPSASPVSSAAPALLPERERRELHDALEKMAWEAFGPVAESLVREAVERIERIAWEVIPQLAESLIKEELRKLKGE
jgi:CheY-like chemotaxis protein